MYSLRSLLQKMFVTLALREPLPIRLTLLKDNKTIINGKQRKLKKEE